MCGIVGYAGKGRVAPILIEGLRRLEYRGYDSAGIAVLGQKLAVVKRKGRVEAIAAEAEKLSGGLGIAHTRWATHGEPSERNAHPHRYGGVAVVHNGIIENAALLRAECEARGEVFSSETDSEVIAHLIAAVYRGDLLQAVREAVRRLEGSYAIAVLAEGERAIVAARRKSPLLVGRGEGSVLASDLPAIAPLVSEVYSLKEGGFALLTEDNVCLFDEELREWEEKPIEFGKVEEDGGKGGYPHYMRKEIAEDPAAIANSIVDLTANSRFSDLNIVLCQTYYIQIVACGTAYHSGVAAKYAIEALSRVPVEVDIASEYRYRDPIVPKGTLVIAVSQSGETADTLAAAALAKERGAKVLALTNVPYSSLTALADLVLLTHAGRETAVAATKSFCAQLASLYSLAAALAALKGRSAPSLAPFPALCEDALSRSGCALPLRESQRLGAHFVPKEERLLHRAWRGLRRRDRRQSQTQRGELSCERGLSCGRAQTRHARSCGGGCARRRPSFGCAPCRKDDERRLRSALARGAGVPHNDASLLCRGCAARGGRLALACLRGGLFAPLYRCSAPASCL